MEISKMLTLCTSHVTDKTLQLLDEDATANEFPCLSIYKKDEYGYFIYINENEFRKQSALPDNNMPSDLTGVIAFTIEAGCNILCLDCDGEELVCLPHYEYRPCCVNGHDVSEELCYYGGGLTGKNLLDYRV